MPITLFGYTYLTCTAYLDGGKAQIHWPLLVERVHERRDESGEGTSVVGDVDRVGRRWRDQKADGMSKRT